MSITTDLPGFVTANCLEIYVEQVGYGPDVLLIGGLGDTVESWQFQLDWLADRYRMTAFDNRGAGRTAMPAGPVTVNAMADDAAGVLRALDIACAHVAGFSGGSIIAQELALRHPQLVRSLVLQSTWAAPDPYLRARGRFVRWLVEAAPSERAFLEGFFLDIYTPARTTMAPSSRSSRTCWPSRTSRPPRTCSGSWTPSSSTTPATAWGGSSRRRSCSPAGSTRPAAQSSAAPSPS
jgi:pimeloyl-ACP methyl ester carboxylesterase